MRPVYSLGLALPSGGVGYAPVYERILDAPLKQEPLTEGVRGQGSDYNPLKTY